jgi:hypothetical protein
MWKLVLPVVLVIFLMGLLTNIVRANRKKPEFYHLPNLTSNQVQLLQNANLLYSPPTMNGAWVKNKNLPKALKLLKARHHATSKMTNGTFMAILSFDSATASATANRISFKGTFPVRQERIARLVENVLATVIGDRQLVIWGNQCEPPIVGAVNDGKFHLILTCDKQLPNQKEWQKRDPTTILSISTKVKLNCRPANTQALPFVDFATGHCLCELEGNKLYLLFDVLASQDKLGGRFKRLTRRLAFSGEDNYLGLLTSTLAYFAKEVVWEQEVQTYLEKAGLQTASVDAFLQEQDLGIPHKQLDLKISGFAGDNRQIRRQAVIAKLSEQILGSLCRDSLTIINFGGRVNPPSNAQDLVIKFNCSPMAAKQISAPRQYWGLPFNSPSTTIPLPSPYGLPIFDSRYNVAGEIVEREIYVYQELMTYGSGEECLLWATFLINVRQLLLKAQEEHTQEEILEEFFANECLHQVDILAGQAIRPPVSDAEHERLSNKLGQSLLDQRKMYETELNPNLDLGEEFDSIVSIPKVVDVKVEEDKVIVHTTDIFCHDNRSGKLHYIGPFKIVIPSQGSGEGVRWYNQVSFKRYNDHQAPHVDKSGKACLGNMAEVFNNLIAKRHFAAAVEAAIAFVEAANTEDTWGKHISEYPLAQTQTAAS